MTHTSANCCVNFEAGSRPLLVFDNRDNIRSIDHFGDGALDRF
jgi:hypothetical protein